MSASDDQSEKECPLCMEQFDLDDINFYPCKCEYQICRFCWHRLKTDENGLCPACRQPYPEDPVNFKPLTPEEFQRIKNEKKQREHQKKQKISDSRKHLAKVRVLQKNLVFIIGLPQRFCEAELLKRPEYFGKFGKVHKVVVNANTNYAGPSGPSTGIFITYYREEDALRAIQCVNSVQIDGRCVKASLGTTKYCSNFLRNQPCHKPDCMYLHDIGEEAASFTKEDMQQHKHTEYERRLHEQILPQIQGNRRFLDSSGQREVWPATSESENAARKRQSEPIPVFDRSSTAASQNHSGNNSKQTQSTRTRQRGSRGRNNQHYGTANGTSVHKQREDAKQRASPPAASLSPDRNGRSFQSTIFSSSSTQGLCNGHDGDSVTHSSTSSSPSLLSSSLPDGGTPPMPIETAPTEIVAPAEVDTDSARTKSPSVGIGQKEVENEPQQLVCNGGIDDGYDDGTSKLNALFSKLLGETAQVADGAGNCLENSASVAVGQGDAFLEGSQRKTNTMVDWQMALGLKKEAHDDDLGFDPYMESAKALEEMVREEKELSERQQQQQQHHHQHQQQLLFQRQQTDLGASQQWDYRNRYPQQQQHPIRPGHVRPTAAGSWHSSNPPMMANQYTARSPLHFSPQSPPENIPLSRMEFVNSNYAPRPAFGGDLPTQRLNGVVSGPQTAHPGQLRQPPQPEWQDGFRAMLPNVNVKFATNLSAPRHAPSAGLAPTDPPGFPPKPVWPVSSGPPPPRPTSDNIFMFNRPPPPYMPNCSYPPPGIRRSPTVESTPPVAPVRVNTPQQLPFARAMSPFRHDFMNWPMDDLSPTSQPPPGFMGPPSQQNMA